jgi:transcriptional regulator with XRE-family HTH domain
MARPSVKYSGNNCLVALGNAIREMRRERNLSQEALAAESELDRSYVGGIERGEHNLTVMNLQKIAAALGSQPSQVFARARF